MPTLDTGRRRPRLWALRDAVRRRRRTLAALTAAAAVWVGLSAFSPAAPLTAAVPVAARDLPTGARLGADDVVMVGFPRAAIPAGVVLPTEGSVLAAPLRQGEPFTDVRLAGAAGGRPQGTVVVTVRVADPAATLAIHPGDRVDLLAGPASGMSDPVGDYLDRGPADDDFSPPPPMGVTSLGRNLLVLEVPASAQTSTDDSSAGLLAGPGEPEADVAGVLVVAVDHSVAVRLAAAVGRPLTVAVVGP